MAIKVHSDLPSIPDSYKTKVQDEETNMSFKKKSPGTTVTYESSGKKTVKCNKLNLGGGKDVFLVWAGEDVMVYGWSLKHGKTNKDYVGYFLGKKERDFSIS